MTHWFWIVAARAGLIGGKAVGSGAALLLFDAGTVVTVAEATAELLVALFTVLLFAAKVVIEIAAELLEELALHLP